MEVEQYTGALGVLFQWQDLAGALAGTLVSGVAVVVSVRALRAAQRQVDVGLKQLNLTHAQDEARRKSRENAMRASLPPVLSEIIRWTKSITDGLRELPLDLKPAERKAYRIPEIGKDVGEALSRMIEATDNEVLIVRLSSVIGNMQVLHARLGMINDTGMGLVTDNIDSFILDSLVVYAQASSLFDYARRHADVVPVRLPYDDLSGAVDSMGLHGPRWAALYRMIDYVKTDGKNFEDLHDKG